MRPIRRFGFIVAAAVLAAARVAAAPAHWTVDPQTSEIRFNSQFNAVPFSGTFKSWTADIAFDPADLSGSKVTVTIDLASAITGDATRDQSLPTAEWFDVAKFPKARFVTKSIKDLGGGRYEATADLDLHGVTHELVLPFTLMLTGDRAAMKGMLTLQRNLFKVGNSYFADPQSVPFGVGISVVVNARRAP
jgi:polyisoprenoid-binding protein YceI